LREALDRHRPDVVSIWNLGHLSWSLPTIVEERGIPIVLTFLDHWVTFVYHFDPWTRIFDKRPWAAPFGRLLGLTTRLPTFDGASASAASHWIDDLITAHSRWKFPDSPVIPLGVDTHDFPLSNPTEQPWAWRLLYVGRVVPDKGVATLIASLPHLPPETTLDIVGHAPPQILSDLTRLVHELGVTGRVTFSRASREELRDRYRRADLVVFPSEWDEPFGIVPLEAMACGVPVLATGTGGSADYLDDGVNCVLFTAGDAVALAAGVRTIADDLAIREHVVRGGRRTAERLTMDAYTDAIERFHVEAVTRRG
jgi:glycosyltransferase involved in cell wall biosynthesis